MARSNLEYLYPDNHDYKIPTCPIEVISWLLNDLNLYTDDNPYCPVIGFCNECPLNKYPKVFRTKRRK